MGGAFTCFARKEPAKPDPRVKHVKESNHSVGFRSWCEGDVTTIHRVNKSFADSLVLGVSSTHVGIGSPKKPEVGLEDCFGWPMGVSCLMVPPFFWWL